MQLEAEGYVSRLFGSSREQLAKSNADLNRFVDSLTRSNEHKAFWVLMDCAVTVFHIGDRDLRDSRRSSRHEIARGVEPQPQASARARKRNAKD